MYSFLPLGIDCIMEYMMNEMLKNHTLLLVTDIIFSNNPKANE